MTYSLAGQSILLHGPPKGGKSTIASSFPNPKFWATHPGHGFIPQEQKEHIVMLKPGAAGWMHFKTSLREKDPWSTTGVVDTISDLYRLCRLWVCKQNNWKHTSDGAHGKGWDMVKDEFIVGMQLLGRWMSKRKNRMLIFIDQTKEVEIELESTSITKVMSSMPGHARGVVTPIANHIWFLGYAGSTSDPLGPQYDFGEGQRVLYLKGTNLIEAGTQDRHVIRRRIPKLKDHDQYQQILTYLGSKEEPKRKKRKKT